MYNPEQKKMCAQLCIEAGKFQARQ